MTKLRSGDQLRREKAMRNIPIRTNHRLSEMKDAVPILHHRFSCSIFLHSIILDKSCQVNCLTNDYFLLKSIEICVVYAKYSKKYAIFASFLSEAERGFTTGIDQ